MAEVRASASSPTGPIDGVLADLGAVVASEPDAVAVRAVDGDLTYAELWSAATECAERLTLCGTAPGDVVALVLPPTSDSVVAMVAVLLSGAAYVPLEPGEPDEIRSRAARLGARTAVTVRPGGAGTEVVEIACPSEVPIASAGAAGDLAYVIFTSGTTGAARAVGITRSNLAFSTRARHVVYPGRETFLLLSPTYFDSSVAGIWGTLTAGATLVVASDDQRRDPSEIARLVESHEVGRTLMIPSLYRELLAAAPVGTRLRSLREVIVAGERLPDELVRAHFESLPDTDLVNEYGPTEATVWATFRRYSGVAPSRIGRPVPGVELVVVGQDDLPVDDGEPGELLIGGEGVAAGYLGDADGTARAFVVLEHLGEGRWYRTGDMVRRDGDEYAYLGRSDRQVKVLGHRIELDAVEVALQALPGVLQAVAHVSADDTHLVAHLVVADPEETASVVAAARQVRPARLRPGEVVVHDRLPVTANGKVDVTALRAAATPVVAAVAEPTRTDDDTALVAAAWREVLGRTDVATDANFFDLGGNSMLMIRLQRRLVAATGREIPVVSLFQHATVATQVAMLSADRTAAGAESRMTRAERARLARARRRRQAGE